MISNFASKIKESVVSVVPVMLIVVLLHFFLTPLPDGQLAQFIVGGVLLIVGLSVFLIGADLGMIPFGQRVGSALTQRRNLPLILIASFTIGFAITVAEPDVLVLVSQVAGVAPTINTRALLFMIAAGVGIFLLVGMLRVYFQISLRLLLIVFYAMVFLVSAYSEPGFVCVAFDSGGATTGPITVPFIMAIGIGVASTMRKSESEDSSFGFVGLASIGPISAVALMGLFAPVDMSGDIGSATESAGLSLAGHFLTQVPHVVKDITMALLPLLVILVAFQVTLLKLPFEQVKRLLLGMAYTFIGLVVFMVGVSGGFTPVGRSLGIGLGGMENNWELIIIGFVLGAVVVCAEPAVWVLNEQVEEVSGGYIRRSVMLASLSISIALAVALGMMRVLTGISIWWLIVPGYALALVLTRYCPPLFTAIAFDSGGVASGPMSTTFVLSLTLGASVAVGGNPATDAFGMVAMIAMAPLITIQALGLAFKHMEERQKK